MFYLNGRTRPIILSLTICRTDYCSATGRRQSPRTLCVVTNRHIVAIVTSGIVWKSRSRDLCGLNPEHTCVQVHDLGWVQLFISGWPRLSTVVYLWLNWASSVSGPGREGSVSAAGSTSVALSKDCLRYTTLSNMVSRVSSSLLSFYGRKHKCRNDSRADYGSMFTQRNDHAEASTQCWTFMVLRWVLVSGPITALAAASPWRKVKQFGRSPSGPFGGRKERPQGRKRSVTSLRCMSVGP